MALFETLVILLLVSAGLLQLSRKLKIPYPTLLALAGACVAIFPWAPNISFDPHLALALFVAPAILSAAYDTSPYELRRSWLPLISLAVFAVLLTTAAVAWAGWMFAGLPLAAAVALGAIVAPPDAAAATAVLANSGLPRRTLTLLQGESLLNDAVALLIFGGAVAAVSGGEAPLAVLPKLLVAVPGGVVLGLVAGWLYSRIWQIWSGTLGATILDFTTTFGVWLLAERIHVSPILAVVAYAMLLARYGPTHQSPRDRVHSYAVWDSVVFILNVLAFMLMGLQARGILQRLDSRQLWDALGFAVAVFAITVVVRVAWVLSWRTLMRPLLKGFRDPTRNASNTRVKFLVSWCGMRGILTLATAFALPAHFPGRDIIVLSAFTVVLGTLVVQGGTIGLLIKLFGIPPDASLDEELAEARKTLAEAGLAHLGDRVDPQTRRLKRQLTETLTGVQDDPDSELGADFDETRMTVTRAQRDALNGMHDRGVLAEDVFQALQEELDWRELSLAPRHELVIDEG